MPKINPDLTPTQPASRHERQQARRQHIMESIIAEGSIRIEDLCTRFGISLMTAHRDIDDMIGKGLLQKNRGIVSAAPTSLIEASDIYRKIQQAPEKNAVAQLAAQFVEPGQAIFFDDSTTTLQMIPHLQDKTPFTAITNSLTLINAMKNIRDLTLLGLGGYFHNWCNAFLGPTTRAEIRRLRADCCFLSISAISGGMTLHQSAEMADIKRAMFDSSQKRILLIDHTKFKRRALHAMGPLNEFDLVIVDDHILPQDLEYLHKHKINVRLAPLIRTPKHSTER